MATSSTASPTPTLTADQLRLVVAAAALAPSIHNTQPWRWVAASGGLDLYADPTRQLLVADPAGRQMLVSCGAALLHARLAIRRLGLVPRVTLAPAGEDGVTTGGTPAASIRVAGDQAASPDERALADAMERRHTDRRPFEGRPIPDAVVDAMRAAAENEGAWLATLANPDLRIDTAVLTARADWLETHDPAYRAELERWSRTGPGAVDGIPRDVVVAATGDRPAEFVMRDFDVAGEAGLRLEQTDVERPTVVIIGTDADRPTDHLVAGEALERVLLTATVHDIATSPLGQAVDVESTRALLGETVGGLGHIQMLVRVGYPLADATPLPATPRRAVDDILVIRGGVGDVKPKAAGR
jgi:hypothetical protein